MQGSLCGGLKCTAMMEKLNKDHQRMMVDPMFMIVKNVRLFLTAVTPTAVAPTADQFGPYWTILNHIKPF